ncbi:GBF-interacting protein 1, N-terminal [Dillenia turbinata]|uniref:GBF-interacting protein 1, N-terminal n=1 Tax=Dillenia turbinata TaxID=194707 RepID=A0AAN8ZMI0_9MAGN
MSDGKVTIPESVKKTIENIKEIAGHHSDEDIYAMLKECSMDPNETAQKLLYLDTFHVVKRKRDRRKENLSSQPLDDSRKRNQGRGARGARANSSSYTTSDAGNGRNTTSRKDRGFHDGHQKDASESSKSVSEQTRDKATSQPAKSFNLKSNGPSNVPNGSSTHDRAVMKSAGGFPNSSLSGAPAPMSGVSSSASDPVLLPSPNSGLPAAVGTIRLEGERRFVTTEPSATVQSGARSTATPNFADHPLEDNLTSDDMEESKFSNGTKSYAEASLFSFGSPTQSRSIGVLKGQSGEVKPNLVQESEKVDASGNLDIIHKTNALSLSKDNISNVEEMSSTLHKKREELIVSHRQPVIISKTIVVPEAAKNGLTFGSINADLGVNMNRVSDFSTDKSSAGKSDFLHENQDIHGEQIPSKQGAVSAAQEEDCPDHEQSPSHMPENPQSPQENNLNGTVSKHSNSKQDMLLPPGGPAYPVGHTAPSYSFGFITPVIGSPPMPVEGVEILARDSHTNFVVTQQLDRSTGYSAAPLYRPIGDSHLSSVLASGTATKYGGSMGVISQQTFHSPDESENSLIMSTTGATQLVTLPAGMVQSSFGMSSHPVTVFRPPYPPNFIPYGHYISPFYVPPSMHQYLGHSGFPQQPSTRNAFLPPTAASAGVKLSLPPYKNIENVSQIGITSFVPSQVGYNSHPVMTTGNLPGNEDVAASQPKENGVYAPVQTEGFPIWVATPGRDSSLHANSFYNLPPQAQHLPFTPAQAGHGALPGIYHPTQSMVAPLTNIHPFLQQSQAMAGSVETVGPSAPYQDPQHAHINWNHNF